MDEQSGNKPEGLPAWLTHRRTQLRIGKAEAARRAGVGRVAWHEWEGGKRQPYDTNYAGIEDAMQWESGSVRTINEGGEPTNARELTKAEQRRKRIDAFVRAEGLEPTPELVQKIEDEIDRLDAMHAAVRRTKSETQSHRTETPNR